MSTNLKDQHCQRDVHKLDAGEIEQRAAEIDSIWIIETDVPKIVRTFTFKNYYRTISFVNAVAWMAHQEDHHPDLEVGYSRCIVHYSTHSVGGLSNNDFICAAKLDALIVNQQ